LLVNKNLLIICLVAGVTNFILRGDNIFICN
jgi:hypothetical protein